MIWQVVFLCLCVCLLFGLSCLTRRAYVKECKGMTVDKFVGKCVELGKAQKMAELESFVKKHVAFFMLNQKKIQARLEEIGNESNKGVS